MIMFLFHFPCYFRTLRQYFSIMIPHNVWFRISFNLTIHNNQLTTIFRSNSRFFHESWGITFRFRFRFDIQIKVRITFSVFIFHMTSIRATVWSYWILLPLNSCLFILAFNQNIIKDINFL